jgi:formamidopyrimidine-DNA glycosylase
MFEMPEATTIATQMNQELAGRTIRQFARGSLVHKFLWLNRPDGEMAAGLAGKTVRGASSYGRSIYLHLGGDSLLWFAETGGRLLFHPAGADLPSKVHLVWHFADGSALTFAMQMWGAVKLLDKAEFGERPHKEAGIPPLSTEFSLACFEEMLESYPDKTKKGVKGFLVTSVHVNGLGNAYVQDILFQAGIDQRRKIPALGAGERRRLYTAIQETMSGAIALGGRAEECDLFGQPGRYTRSMSSQTAGRPCPVCGTAIQKISYLGGACYLCPKCQV